MSSRAWHSKRDRQGGTASGPPSIGADLKTGGFLGFTSWEQSGYSERLGVEQCADYRPLLEAAGLTVEAYEEPPDWQRQHRALREGLIAGEAEMSGEMEPAVAARFAAMARGGLADMALRRYIQVIAQKR
jgi:hypothetical protein